jgi:hypothetical protein
LGRPWAHAALGGVYGVIEGSEAAVVGALVVVLGAGRATLAKQEFA